MSHTDQVTSIVMLPNGHLASGSVDKTINIWDLENNGALMQTLTNHVEQVNCLATLNNSLLVSGSSDSFIIVWELFDDQQWTEVFRVDMSSSVLCMAVLENGNLAVGTYDYIYILNGTSFEQVGALPIVNYVGKLAVLENNTLASNEDDIQIWDTDSFSLRRRLVDTSADVDYLALLALSNGLLLSGSSQGALTIWDPSDGSIKLSIKLNVHNYAIRGLAELHNGYLVSADNAIKVWRWDAASFTLREILFLRTAHRKDITALLVCDNGDLVSSSEDNTIKVWREV